MGFVFDELSNKVINAAIQVHKRLGPGFLESVYERALRLELTDRQIPFESQKEISIVYEGKPVGTHTLDLFVDGVLVVELKAVERFEDIHFAQVKSYLRASGAKLGLLLNFNATQLSIKRIVLGYPDNRSRSDKDDS
jgi:GxxExxY protein